MSDRTSADALLPGTGYSPDYGINDSVDGDSMTSSSEKSSTPAVSQSTQDGPKKKNRIWVVAMCALIACLASLVNGLMLSFSSPTLDILSLSPSSAHYIKNGSTVASLFGAFGPIGAMGGGLVAWPVSDMLGRQAALILSGVPALAGWLMITYSYLAATNSAFLGVIYTGRVLTGFSAGWSIFCVSVYIAEVSPAKLKGLFGNCNQLFITIGGFLGYLYGVPKFNIQYWHFALGAAAVVTIFEILMLFTYETPRWLFSKHKEFQGVRVLKILRGPNAHITKEINQIKAAIRRKHSVIEQLLEFRHRAVFIPFILVLMLMFFQQFSGINAVIFYASDIFKQAGIPRDEVNLISALAIGLVQVIATLVSVFLVDHLGRKLLLTVSSVLMCLSSFILGIYYYIFNETCKGCLGDFKQCPGAVNATLALSDPRNSLPCSDQNFGYLAVVCVVCFIIGFSLAWGPIPWTSMSELMPHRVRTLAASMATFVNWMFATIITLCFHKYATAITEAGAFWSFAVIMAAAIVLVILFLPETKGHSLEEIQEHFEKGEIFAVTCRRTRPEQPRTSTSRFSTTRSVSVVDT